jgi:mono/diheme cytochrome c family protein
MVGFKRARPDRIDDVRKLVLLLAALVLVVAIPACGGEEDEQALPETVEGTLPTDTGGGAASEGDPANGKTVYASAGCGGCHTFSAAGSTGTVGPNLDEASIDFDAAVQQIENGGGGMPPFGDRLSDQEIADVAAFITQ